MVCYDVSLCHHLSIGMAVCFDISVCHHVERIELADSHCLNSCMKTGHLLRRDDGSPALVVCYDETRSGR